MKPRNKKVMFGLLLVILIAGLVFAAQGSGSSQRNNNSEKCEDSDKGIVYYEKGELDVGCTEGTLCGVFVDYCKDENILVENYCRNNQPLKIEYKCPFGCDEGACVKKDGETIIGGQKDEHGCLIAAGYSWNETEEKCIREWEQGENRYQNEDSGIGQEIRNRVRAGIYTNENGEEIRVSEMAQNKLRLNVNNISADCNCEMEEEKIQNKTRLKTKLSNGKYFEIKIMPDTASEKALERLRIKVCSAENNCTIELKETGKGEKVKMSYELQAERHALIIGIFQAKMQVKAQVDAENGEIIQIKKPWWAFLASESEEEF